MLAPRLEEVIPRYCPHCGIQGMWAIEHVDGIQCWVCGCILYKDEPIDDLRGHGGFPRSQSDGRLKKNRRDYGG